MAAKLFDGIKVLIAKDQLPEHTEEIVSTFVKVCLNETTSETV